MTAATRITQADMVRATNSVKNAGIERARIIMDLANARIEVIIGDEKTESHSENPWDDE